MHQHSSQYPNIHFLKTVKYYNEVNKKETKSRHYGLGLWTYATLLERCRTTLHTNPDSSQSGMQKRALLDILGAIFLLITSPHYYLSQFGIHKETGLAVATRSRSHSHCPGQPLTQQGSVRTRHCERR